MDDRENGDEIAHVLGQLASLDAERAELKAKLARLERDQAQLIRPDRHVAM